MKETEKDKINCPICKSEEFQKVFRKNIKIKISNNDIIDFIYNVVICKNCGFTYWNPRKNINDMENYYAKVYRVPVDLSNIDDFKKKQIEKRYYLISEYIKNINKEEKKLSLLEIGSAEGYFLKICQDNGLVVYGIEPSKKYAEISKKILGKQVIYQNFYEKLNIGKKFNIICSFFVLEHVFNINLFLSKCYEMLNDKGILFLESPNLENYDCQYSGMMWHEHTYHFNITDYIRILKNNGFKIKLIKSHDCSYDFGLSIIAQKIDRKGLSDYKWSLYFIKKYLYNKDNYNKVLLKTINKIKDSKIIIYGTGVYSKQLIEKGKINKNNIIFFIDDNKDKIGEYYYGKIIRNIDIIKNKISYDKIIIASNCFYNKMYKNLIIKKVNPDKIMLIHNIIQEKTREI